MDSETKKAINFDLDTKKMKELGVYPQGYRVLKKYMKEFGFKHRQWSGYESINPMSNNRIRRIIKQMAAQYEWLSYCAVKFDITDISKEHNLLRYIRKVLDEQFEEAGENTKLTIDKADEAVIERIHNSKYGEVFDILASGKSSLEEKKADRRVMNMLAFFTDCNPEQMIRIYKSTALYSEEKGESYVFSIVMQTIDNASQIKTAPNKTQHISKINSNENAK